MFSKRRAIEVAQLQDHVDHLEAEVDRALSAARDINKANATLVSKLGKAEADLAKLRHDHDGLFRAHAQLLQDYRALVNKHDFLRGNFDAATPDHDHRIKALEGMVTETLAGEGGTHFAKFLREHPEQLKTILQSAMTDLLDGGDCEDAFKDAVDNALDNGMITEEIQSVIDSRLEDLEISCRIGRGW